MAVVPIELHCVLADGLNRTGLGGRFEHWQLTGLRRYRLSGRAASGGAFFVAQCARAGVSQVGKCIGGKVAVFPLDLHSFAGTQVNFDGLWIGRRHGFSIAKNEVRRRRFKVAIALFLFIARKAP